MSHCNRKAITELVRSEETARSKEAARSTLPVGSDKIIKTTAATQPPIGEARAAAALASPIGGCGRRSGRGHNHQERRDTGFHSPCPPSRGFKPAGRMPTSSRRSPALRLVSQQTYLPHWAIARPWVDWGHPPASLALHPTPSRIK